MANDFRHADDAQLLELRATVRATLAEAELQHARYGINPPTSVMHQIDEARAKLDTIQAELLRRAHGKPVESPA
jgi:hypothetical protein